MASSETGRLGRPRDRSSRGLRLSWTMRPCKTPPARVREQTSSAERLVDRHTLRREEAGALLGDVETVFQADAELAIDGDHRLVAEAHSRRDRRGVAADEVGPLVAVEPDAMAGAVRQSRHPVVRAEAGIG